MSDNSEVHAAEFVSGLVEMVNRAVVPLEQANAAVLGNPRRLYQEDGRYSEQTLALMRQVRELAAEAGFYAAFCPPELGGEGFGSLTRFLAWEALYATFGPARILPYQTLAHWTTGPSFMLGEMHPDVRAAVLPGVLAGTETICFAMSEPDAGSDAWEMSTSATLVDGHWQLSGTKQWISHASYADYAFVFAVTDDQARRERRGGITCFLVPTAADGFRVDSVIRMMGRIGGSECIVSLSDVRVPETHVVGEVGAGFALALRGVNEGRMYNAGRAVGMAQWALGLATDYAQTRRAGGAAIGSHQSVANLLADSAIDIYGGRTMSVQCAREIDDGRSPNIVRDLSIVKAFTTEMGVRVFDRCMQVHGAMGMTNELRLYDGWHQTRAAMVADGTAEIMRRTIAKQLLRGRLDFRTEQPLLAGAR